MKGVAEACDGTSGSILWEQKKILRRGKHRSRVPGQEWKLFAQIPSNSEVQREKNGACRHGVPRTRAG